jgi:nucleoside-diphosphate-sugar epimerase
MSKTKILLTGGNGFIGKNILQILGSKYDMMAPSSSELNLLNKDDVGLFLKENMPDVILHAAAEGGSRKIKTQSGVLNKNLQMFYNLCAYQEFFGKMITFGSGAEYDKRSDISSVNESDFGQHIPVDEYGLAKFTMSKLIENVENITHLRFFAVFGPHEDYSARFISNIICKTLLGVPVTVKQNAVFDYLYVKDLVKILDYFILHKAEHVFYNIGSGKPITLISLAEKIVSLINKKSPIIVENIGFNNEYTCNIDRLKAEIKHLEFTGTDHSLKEMIAYYQSISPKLDKSLLIVNI